MRSLKWCSAIIEYFVAVRRHQQLGFPWCDEALRRVDTEELQGDGNIRIEIRDGSNEIALWLATVSRHLPGHYWYSDDRFEVRLRLAHPVWCRVNGTRASWDMERVCPPEFSFAIDATGPFAAAVDWALYQLDPSSRNAFRDEQSVTLERPWRAALVRASNDVADRALAMCDQHARERASTFHPDSRLFVYGALIADASLRTEQMIESCPGLLVLAGERHHPETLIGITRGVRLATLVRAVLPTSVDERTAALLVRRAGRGHSPSTLRAAISAVGIDINDMPKEREARVRWYQATAHCQQQQRRLPARADRQRFGSFVSKYATELDAIADARCLSIEIVLTEILDWNIHGPGTVPSRRSSVARVLEAVATWHAGLWAGTTLDPQTPLPPAPIPSANIDGISVEPIKTVGELAVEGAVMHHCIASYANAALDGHVVIYRGKVRGQRVTLAIARDGDRWRLVDGAGFANRLVQDPEVVRQWLDAFDATPKTHAT